MCRRSSQNSINLSRSSRMLSWSIKCNPGNLKGFYNNYGNPFPIYSTVPATLHYTQINHQWTLHWTVWLLLMSCCTHSLRQTNQTNQDVCKSHPFLQFTRKFLRNCLQSDRGLAIIPFQTFPTPLHTKAYSHWHSSANTDFLLCEAAAWYSSLTTHKVQQVWTCQTYSTVQTLS